MVGPWTLNDAEKILEVVIERAHARLEGQLRDNDALDVKALGVLAADGAAIGVLVAVHDAINSFWWIPAAILGVAAVLLLASVWPRNSDIGPDWREFYGRYGDGEFLPVGRQLLGELVDAIDWNEARAAKSRYLRTAFVLVLVGLLGSLLASLAR